MNRYTLILLSVAFSLFGCTSVLDSYVDAPEPGAPGMITGLTAEPGLGVVTFRWTNPSEHYYYTDISYEDLEGHTITKQASVYSVDPELGEGYTKYMMTGFEFSSNYTFTLIPYNATGEAGPATKITCQPEDKYGIYKIILNSLQVEPQIQGAQLSWTNEWEAPVTVSVSFTDVTGTYETVMIEESDKPMTVSVGAFVETTELTLVAYNRRGEASEPYKVTVTPIATGEIPVSRISVLEVDSQHQSYRPSNMLDRKTDTYWHSTNATNIHHAIFDLGGIHKVNAAEIVRRLDRSDTGDAGRFWITHVNVYISSNNEDYKKVYDDDFEYKYKYGHILPFGNDETCRYIKIELTSTMLYTHIAEFCAYYHEHPEEISPFADLAKAERQ